MRTSSWSAAQIGKGVAPPSSNTPASRLRCRTFNDERGIGRGRDGAGRRYYPNRKIQFRTPKIRVAKERAAINNYEYPPDDLKISR